jgi:signal transduction histidine kinase/ActR/RegA family two-component response regulator
MKPSVDRRLEALELLAERVAKESAGGLVGDALDALLTTTAASHCLAFGSELPLSAIAERARDAVTGHDSAAMSRALSRVVANATSTRRPVYGPLEELLELVDAPILAARGVSSLLVHPVVHRRSVIAVLVALFEPSAGPDESARTFTATVAHLVALGLEAERRQERERGERERLAVNGAPSVGLLTTAVAQELRGPASALGLQWDELSHAVEQIALLAGTIEEPLGAVIRELAEVSQDMGATIGKLRETTERLLAMGKRESSPEHVDVSLLARRSIVVARSLLEERGVPLEEHYEADCLTIGRRDDLEQVVLNLLLNAAEAAAKSQSPHIWLRVQGDSNHIVLVVEDSGPGVPPELVESIFQPFFTTKAQGRGSGLGLKIVSEVVAAHGGHIEVHQRKGGGASFRVVLPRVSPSGIMTSASRVPGTDGTGVRRVFVVDDDPIFSRALRRGLKPHDVRTASSASEAEMQLLDPAYYPDLVVCDVFLPGANGDVLHQRVKLKRPEIAARFVFVTGAALGGAEADYLKRSGCPALLKPIDVHGLRALLSPRETRESTPPTSVRTLAEPSTSDLPTVAPPARR